MNQDARIRELSERHKRLDAELQTAMRYPAGDEVRVHDLKRQKLKLKDELVKLQSH